MFINGTDLLTWCSRNPHDFTQKFVVSIQKTKKCITPVKKKSQQNISTTTATQYLRIKLCIPPGCTIKISNLFSVSIQNCREVVSGVFTFKQGKYNCVLGRIWFWNIGNLKLHFHGALPMIPTKFKAHVFCRYWTTVPCQNVCPCDRKIKQS